MFFSYIKIRFFIQKYEKVQDSTTAAYGQGGHVADLRGHEDAVQAVCFDPKSKFMVSGGSDCTFRVWAMSG